MVVINLIGQPGAGKSTTAAGLFFLMKQQHFNVELVTEYTKDLFFERNDFVLSDELLVFAEKYKRIKRLEGGVDFVITDSPLVNSVVYVSGSEVEKAYFTEVASRFDNVYVLVRRGAHAYQAHARFHDEVEAQSYETKFRAFLDEAGLPYFEVTSDADAPATILAHPSLARRIDAKAPLFASAR